MMRVLVVLLMPLVLVACGSDFGPDGVHCVMAGKVCRGWGVPYP